MAASTATIAAQRPSPPIGVEVAVRRHLQDGEEFAIPLRHLLQHGEDLFQAKWTSQDGGGRPLTKGTGAPLSDPSSPLTFPRAFNRISAADSNSCAGCHNSPFVGGGGDFVTGVFVLGHRFDFATFDHTDLVPTRGSTQENGRDGTLQTIANYRATVGMNGSGFIELLAREMTIELQRQRDAIPPGGSAELSSKGVAFGVLSRAANGDWITAAVTGLPAPSLATAGSTNPPDLILRPFHQAGAVISLRQFTNNAFNHHHGMQSSERFGENTDPDGDGHTKELTRADITAVSLWQATLPVPGRVIPRDHEIEAAIRRGEELFTAIGCAACHVPTLPLADSRFVEPGPFNPAGNLRQGEAPAYVVDLLDPHLAGPRLPDRNGVVMVPAFTDMKLHDICYGPGDPNIEPLDMQAPPGSAEFFAGNRHFLTRRLWGCANEFPYFHHGQYTTLREAILAHAGEASASSQAFANLPAHDRDCIVECLKTLQVLPPGTRSLYVDEHGHPRRWDPSF
ncbi:MAG: thiol oxidoreductase [Planctomycetes bacterium]|nr:thiol oxidoreductase [Planctomycetota bacterium]